ncbi:MAG TPA: cytochrome c [Nitrospiraceae bacterium]|nr:cytochrome c [Nitrospiraceae bacterium]
MPMMIPPARRRFGLWWHLSLVIAAGVWTAAAAEQPQTAEEEQGKRIFQRNCAGCHGREGTGEGYRLLGADPANLTSRQTQEKSDEDLLESIHEGQQGMPAWKDRLSNEDRRRVLAYIRSLAQ